MATLRGVGRRRLRDRDKAVASRQETRAVDFKSQFEPNSEADCIELVKDVVAMANSGGGIILIGIKDNGEPSGADVSAVVELDPAHLTDKLFRYTAEHFGAIEISKVTRQGTTVALIEVHEGNDLLVFTRPGNYVAPNGKQKTAFAIGGVYFRHGAKSEPCTPSDLSRYTAARIRAERERWMTGIRQVVEAPRGADLAIVERTRPDSEGRPTRVRLTNDPDAPVFGRLNPDETHPHRQSGVLAALNRRLGGRGKVNQHDILSVRSVHKIDDKSHPEFAYKPNYDSMH